MLKHIKTFTTGWGEGGVRSNFKTPELRSLKMCKKCFTFYYKNSWHIDRPKQLEEEDEPVIPVCFTECPSCLEEEVALYEIDALPA